MRIGILQFSDMHLNERADNPILGRREKIITAIRALFLQEIRAVIVIFNGDVAYAGKPTEYILAKGFFTSLLQEIEDIFPEAIIDFNVIPGNHDDSVPPIVEGFGGL